MKIIEPSVELWTQEDSITHVARCARVCYKKESGNDKKRYDSLIKSNHWSMFRHESVYACINLDDTSINKESIKKELNLLKYCPYIDYIYAKGTYCEDVYISTNMNFIMDNENNEDIKELINIIKDWRVSPENFFHTEEGRKLMRFTFKVTTQISTSRELNRVSPNNIAEQSTRYVYEDGTLCRPHWMTDEDYKIFKDEHKDDTFIPEHYLNNDDKIKIRKYVWSCDRSFFDYKNLIRLGMDRQDARGVLPIDTATICVYTYSIKEWRAILDLRYYGTTGKPHPNAKIIAKMIRDKLIELGYEFR